MVRDSKAGEEAPRAAEAFTYELCAGIVDKDASLSRIAKEEILEECGFDVPEDSLEKVVSYRAAVGILGYNTTMFYAEVSEAQRVHQGGGIHDEDIQVVYVPVDECEKFVLQDPSPKPSGIIMAVLWFLKVKNRNVS